MRPRISSFGFALQRRGPGDVDPGGPPSPICPKGAEIELGFDPVYRWFVARRASFVSMGRAIGANTTPKNAPENSRAKTACFRRPRAGEGGIRGGAAVGCG